MRVLGREQIQRKDGALVRALMVATLLLLLPMAATAEGTENDWDTAFVRTAEDGFDDPMNNYAFSSSQLGGAVYVGTGRNFLFRIFSALQQAGILPADYDYQFITHSDQPPWSHWLAEDMSAEIWRYRGGAWGKVYRSHPVDVSQVGFPGAPAQAWAAKEPGFRNMVTYEDKWGDTALYASSAASFVPGRLLLKSTDGVVFEDVVTAPTIVEGDSRSMVVHNGKLYIAPAGAGFARIWATDDPTATGDSSNWQLMADLTTQGTGANVAVVSMVSWRGHLYAGTQNDEAGFQLWRSNAVAPADPSVGGWTQIIDTGAGDMASTRALTMSVFRDALYVGTSMFPLAVGPPFILPPKGFELIRVAEDDSWELIVGDYFAQKPVGGTPALRLPKSGWPGGFANFLNLYCWSLIRHGDHLYLGTFDTTSFLALPFLEALTAAQSAAGGVATSAESAALAAISLGDTPETRAALEQSVAWLDTLDAAQLPAPYQRLAALVDLSDPPSIDWEEVFRVFIEDFAGADLWRSEDGLHWEPVTLNGFDNPTNYGFRTMVRIHQSLHVGSANPFEGLEMFHKPRPPRPVR